jgi:leader peptidase (prepilin peptidase)/N-methyltransferase
VFGSFGNVVIWRLPRGESLSVPPSHCPECDTPIAWFDNIPVLSWFLLLGRCRACGSPISVRYPAVELLSGLLWLAATVKFGLTLQAAMAILFFYVLLLLSFIDLDTMRLPNSLQGVLAVAGAAGVTVSQVTGRVILPLTPPGPGALASPALNALVGATVSAGFMLAVAVVYARVRGAHGFGMGDIKLLAVIGLYLGVYSLVALFVATIAGSVWGLIAARRSEQGMRHRFPFGPFLAASAVLVALFGAPIVGWYVQLFG